MVLQNNQNRKYRIPFRENKLNEEKDMCSHESQKAWMNRVGPLVLLYIFCKFVNNDCDLFGASNAFKG